MAASSDPLRDRVPNLFDPVFEPAAAGARGRRVAAIGRQAGARALEASLYVLGAQESVAAERLPRAAEEMVLVLEGAPSVRGPAGLRHLVPGDVVVWPAGSRQAVTVENLTSRSARVLVLSRPPLQVAAPAGG